MKTTSAPAKPQAQPEIPPLFRTHQDILIFLTGMCAAGIYSQFEQHSDLGISFDNDRKEQISRSEQFAARAVMSAQHLMIQLEESNLIEEFNAKL